MQQAHAAWVIAKKNARIYYLKPPVVSFGIVFPLFFYLAFAIGRPTPVGAMVPSILAMALFFTASAVGPLITPWERQARTYERLATSPASLSAILAGDALAGLAFGALLSFLPLGIGLALSEARLTSLPALAAGIALGGMAFSAMGVVLAAYPADTPSEVMMLSNLMRLPLVFVSGIFVPLAQMPDWGRWLAHASPLSYCADLVRMSFGEAGYFPAWVDSLALVGFTALFMGLAHHLHGRAREHAK